jgi:protein-disulfide isomerase
MIRDAALFRARARIWLLRCAPLCLLASVAAAVDPPPLAPPPVDSSLAHINGKSISYADLEPQVRDKMAAQQHDYERAYRHLILGTARERDRLIEEQLQKLVDDQVLALEAAARHSSSQALLSGVSTPAVTDADMHAFYDSQRSQINQPFDAVAAPMREYLQGIASGEALGNYLRSLREKYRAEITWQPLRERVDAAGPARGPEHASITIVEFSDFECPYCARLAPILRQLLAAYPQDVRLVFRNLPLQAIHPKAFRAAEAAACARAQGKFWEMHDAIYASQDKLNGKELREKAASIGLDAQQFKACTETRQEQTAIQADADAAAQLGLIGTPSSFVNGRFVDGLMPLYQWKALIDDELRRVRSQGTG